MPAKATPRAGELTLREPLTEPVTDRSNEHDGASSTHAHGQPSGRTTGDAPDLIGPHTRRWALVGLIAGAVLGTLLGLLFAYGTLAIARLAPLVAGGAGVATLVGVAFCGAVLSLVGGILGINADARGAGVR